MAHRVHAPRILLPLLASAVVTSAVVAQPAAKAYEDPAPPVVRTLASVEPPEPTDCPERTFVRAPAPLADGATTQDWPCFLGPDRDGHSAETGLLRTFPEAGPALVWSVRRGDGYAGPAIVGKRLVYTHRQGGTAHVDCLHPETGRRYWRFSYPCDFRGRYIPDNGPRATPAIADGRVFVHGIEGMLHCLELTTGRVIWKRDLAEEFGIPDDFFGVVASPLVREGLLIQNIGAPGGPSVAAFDVRTGRLVWGTGARWGPSCASPVVAEVHGRPRLFVLAGGDSRPPTGGLMVMDPASGAIDFEYPFRSRTYESVIGASPVIAGARVFITASYGTGTAALELKPGGGFEEVWKTRRLGLQFSNPIFHAGHLYAIDGRSDRLGAMVCLDPDTGAELSRTDLGWDETVFHRGEEKVLPFSVGEGSILRVDGRFLCLGDNGHLLWLDADPGGARILARASLFRANESWTRPVVSGGLLFVCQNRRERFGREPAGPRLLCFDLRGP